MAAGRSRMFAKCSLLQMCYLLLVPDVKGITTAGNPQDAKYIVQPTTYPYFVSLAERGSCAGAWVSRRHVVTAAHCLCSSGQLMSASSVKTILSDNSFSYPTTHYLNPDCMFDCAADGPNRCDIAILEFSSDIVSASVPVTPYQWNDEVGQTITILGYGLNGDVSTGQCSSDTDANMRRAENVVTSVEGSPGGVIKYIMDQGGLALEGMAQNGDSGGPALIEKNGITYLAGANSGTDESNPCDFGSVDQYARVSAHYSWIQGVVPSSTSSASSTSPASPSPSPSASTGLVSTNSVVAWMLRTPFGVVLIGVTV